MYAIIDVDGGRQYKVEVGQDLVLDYRDGAQQNDEIVFDRVVACGEPGQVSLGTPLVAGASVTAKIVGVEKGPKLVVQKMRRRKNYRKKRGHRQPYTEVKITGIQA